MAMWSNGSTLEVIQYSIAQDTNPSAIHRPGRSVQVSVLWLAAVLLLSIVPGGAEASPKAIGFAESREHVVLLHGLGRSPRSMQPIADFLARHGFVTHNIGYPSTRRTPADLEVLLAEAIRRCCANVRRVHFVTHSLGGILLRAHLAVDRPKNLGRVVLLAPPNRGTEIVDALATSSFFRAVLGPTAAELGTGPDSLPNRIGPPDYEVAIIAARQSWNPLGSAIIPGPDDGTVSIESARLEGASDFLIVAGTHTFIMRRPEVMEQVRHFLIEGRFSRERE